jgi:hypothetical protein
MKFYTGIGSRETPLEIQKLMTLWATYLQTEGYILRSGAARGADEAFEKGAKDNKEIFLPWDRFNNHPSPWLFTDAAYEMAKKYHPAWNRCNEMARMMHARNCHQILGHDLATPSDFVLCWTERGLMKGGTAQALRIAIAYKIPIYNFGHLKNTSDISDFLRPLMGEIKLP